MGVTRFKTEKQAQCADLRVPRDSLTVSPSESALGYRQGDHGLWRHLLVGRPTSLRKASPSTTQLSRPEIESKPRSSAAHFLQQKSPTGGNVSPLAPGHKDAQGQKHIYYLPPGELHSPDCDKGLLGSQDIFATHEIHRAGMNK